MKNEIIFVIIGTLVVGIAMILIGMGLAIYSTKDPILQLILTGGITCFPWYGNRKFLGNKKLNSLNSPTHFEMQRVLSIIYWSVFVWEKKDCTPILKIHYGL